MSAPTIDQLLTQAKDALRAAQPGLALTHLHQLAPRLLTPAQQAQADALRAQAYEYHSQWSEVARLLRPYEDRTRTATLPVAVNHLLCLRLVSLHIEQGALPRALHLARQSLELAKLAEDRSAQGEAHQMLGKAYRLLGQPVFARQHHQAALNLHQAVGARVLMAPNAHLTVTEQASTGTARQLWRSAGAPPRADAGVTTLRIDPWQCPAVGLEIRPAITLTPAIPGLDNQQS